MAARYPLLASPRAVRPKNDTQLSEREVRIKNPEADYHLPYRCRTAVRAVSRDWAKSKARLTFSFL